MQTEFTFTLPRGYVDERGDVHREGTMRLATAMDEIAPLRDPRVRGNEAYLTILILTRVITQLGTIRSVTPGILENLFAADLAFLQDFYRRINEEGLLTQPCTCPNCGHEFEVDIIRLGE
jgi:predicted Zn-ribbon and HTH transcriptional regulator